MSLAGGRPDQTLPPGVAGYWRYPAFTWPWLIRRGMIFWPIAAVLGISFGAWHAASMATWDEFWPLAWRAVLADLLVVSAGPALGTVVRILKFPAALERVFIVAAVAAGVVVAYVAVHWSIGYHEFLMHRCHEAAGCAHVMDGPQRALTLNRLLAVVIGEAPDWAILVALAGGIELIAYFGERRRLEAHAQALALAAATRERDEADARLSILQAQIEPHFLFNTLASVRSLVRTDPAQAATTIDALSNYLRSALPKMRAEAGMEGSTLGEQIDLCQGYLELMAIRMGGRLSFGLEAGEAERALSFPPLILLTLVENAVKHGIEPKVGKGSIDIRAHRVGETLIVEVADDGAGLSPGEGAGLGLANVRAQLKSRFGDRASLDLAGAPGGGATAMVTVPAETP